MEISSFVNPLLGGILIGVAAAGMLWTNGRIMGVSGIMGGLVKEPNSTSLWRVLFILGTLLGGFAVQLFGFSVMEIPFSRGLMAAGIGGLLVGVGTSLGNGCTSGHGVCGISRFSPRSLVATAVFMLLGFVTVAFFRFMWEAI